MDIKIFPTLIIAGIRGGSGKTTITLGIIGALSKNYKVIPFKKGPDYIDSGWMSLSAKSPCYNLDPYLVSKSKVLESFIRHFDGDIAVIEGNRGLYDGLDLQGSYSTAELSKMLKVPVILVIDCTKITRTASALVLGCQKMDEDVMIKGVILNQLSSSRHEKIIRSSIEHYCKIPVLGAMPRLDDKEMPERHMGLLPIHEHNNTEIVINRLSEKAIKHINISALKEIATKNAPSYMHEIEFSSKKTQSYNPVRIGVIIDKAFQFYYPENIDALKDEGAEIVMINSMYDNELPKIDGLYIGGGFPETNAIRLAKNKTFKESLKRSIIRGLPVYAECGGLMYLGDKIVINNQGYNMTGIYDIIFEMHTKPVAHGYTEAIVDSDNPFYPVETVIRGHEFHYSSVSGNLERCKYSFTMKRGKGIFEKKDGIVYKNCLATYTHIHALGTNEWAKGMIRKAKEYKYEP